MAKPIFTFYDGDLFMRINTTEKIFDSILDGMAIICGIIFIFIMVSVCIDVIMRYFLNKPMIWVIEISEYLLVYMTFIGAAWVQKQDAHIRMDIFTMMLKPKARKIIGIINSIISVCICFIISWFGSMETWDNFSHSIHTASSLELPKWPLLAIIPLGSFFLMLQFVRDAVSLVKELNINTRSKY